MDSETQHKRFDSYLYCKSLLVDKLQEYEVSAISFTRLKPEQIAGEHIRAEYIEDIDEKYEAPRVRVRLDWPNKSGNILEQSDMTQHS